ncbi:MAG: tRNA (adenosine(37)-N6)-threonylcarbamoyltransferase complex ATPase subunit type 1 TsaE [Bacillota bacterium]
MFDFKIESGSPEFTRALGELLGRLLKPAGVVALLGNLGAGKTCFTQGVARGLEVAEQVTSPTFVLIKEYRGRLPLYHFDAYRLRSPEELTDLGGEEYFFGPGVCVIEWAERVAEALPEDRIEVELSEIPGKENARIILFRGYGPVARAAVEELIRALHAGD